MKQALQVQWYLFSLMRWVTKNTTPPCACTSSNLLSRVIVTCSHFEQYVKRSAETPPPSQKEQNVLLSAGTIYLGASRAIHPPWPASETLPLNHPKCCSCVFITDACLLSRRPTATKNKVKVKLHPPTPPQSGHRKWGGGGWNGWQTAAFGCAVRKKKELQKYDPVRRRVGGEKTALTFEEKGGKRQGWE